MKNLVIASTKKTPEIIFKTNGDLTITGNSLTGNVDSFYGPVLDWIEALKTKPPKKITITFDLEHLNTSSTRIILQILRTLNKISKKNLHVMWMHDLEDSDMVAQGEILQEIISKSFEFVVKEI